ncbi:MAG TPA: hypothetical protein PK680_09110 [Novosphingobium sp.]|nr:hypothetical protein [Novosphingobium sp.]
MAKTTDKTVKTTAAKKPAATRKPAAAKAAPKAAEPGEAKAKFAKAIEEAKAGAQALASEAQTRAKTLQKDAQAKAGAYKEQLAAKSGDWAEEAKDIAGQAKERAGELAKEGKAKTSDAIAGLGKIVADNAETIDEKLGVKYGDYARSAARSMQETAAKIEAKDLNELGEDAKEFVRKKPGLALGIAAVVGFMVSRLFKGGSDEA